MGVRAIGINHVAFEVRDLYQARYIVSATLGQRVAPPVEVDVNASQVVDGLEVDVR